MPSQASKEIRKTIVKDQLHPDVSILQKRQKWEDYALSLPLPNDVTFKSDHIADVPCLWIQPDNVLNNDLVIYCHGGGLVEGSAITTRDFGARLAKTFCISILVIDYRLAPEHPYPAAINDVTNVYQMLLDKHSYQSEQIILGGDSNGGGLALSSLLKARDDGLPMPSCLFLLSPVLDLTFSGESMTSRVNVDPFTSKEVLIHCAELYAPDEALSTPLISPLFADLTNMPPMLIQVGDHEILLSDSVRLAEKAKQYQLDVTLKIWDEMWHVWHTYSDLPEAQSALEEIRDFLNGYRT